MNSPSPRRPQPDVDTYAEGVLSGDRTVLARAITLVESRRADHVEAAQELLRRLLPHAGGAHRVGLSGVPGVGKSTLVDALGSHLVDQGHRVAVLAVDPSSSRRGGSILGDKTRMARLATDQRAFVRPSPTAGTLGGVARATRETMTLVEAAGYSVVLVETVGVGQSEVAVADMVDTFVFLTLARTGDQLQGIKRGVLELADVIAVNKADGPQQQDARRAARQLARALRLVRSAEANWNPPVLTCSGQEETGLDEVWEAVERHREAMVETGELEERRAQQRVDWLWQTVREAILDRLQRDPEVAKLTPELEERVRGGELTAQTAANRVLRALGIS
ncbi:methylmalonyl Co-A mutase-associated GTPase MeaB [Lipingzhangella sp. LS1_29]|uniref:Methylmalonyl Co-A mutase-associated GTPase MeaB n=1 Tax=Lipingzhangella rawalii TaxID=2055835 RepID=A0ABU2H475_9ACTN|nr:methylmalonyl Co-A mutase-associated GTPase MeaB [Lipingzhangella rawalii]MDS1270101.1 methylmalonyl Co-A mutase-associated GTPase MeaB [Lipingzhangella rawalii]